MPSGTMFGRGRLHLLCLETPSDHKQQNRPGPFALEKLNIKFLDIQSAVLRKPSMDSGLISVDIEEKQEANGRVLGRAYLQKDLVTVCGVYHWGGP